MKNLGLFIRLYFSVILLSTALYASSYSEPSFNDQSQFHELDNILKRHPMPEMTHKPTPLQTLYKCDTHDYIIGLPTETGYRVFGCTTKEDGCVEGVTVKRIQKYKTVLIDTQVHNLEGIHLESYGVKNCKNILIYNKKTMAFMFYHMSLRGFTKNLFPNIELPEQGLVKKNSFSESLPDLGPTEDLKCLIVSFTAGLIVDILSEIKKAGINDIQLSCRNFLIKGARTHTAFEAVEHDVWGTGIKYLRTDEKGIHCSDEKTGTLLREGKSVVFQPTTQTFWHD